MNPSTGSLWECKTLYVAYTGLFMNIKVGNSDSKTRLTSQTEHAGEAVQRV
jgi:hypothetical protein